MLQLYLHAFTSLTILQFPVSEVEGFRDQLREIQATMVDGKFVAEDKSVPSGQDVVVELLERCLLWSDLVLTR